jgi:hypothetical protein
MKLGVLPGGASPLSSLTDVIADQLWHLTGWLAPLAVIAGLTSIALLNWWWR